MTVVSDVWTILRNEPASPSEWLGRRVFPDAAIEIWASLAEPDRRQCLLFHVPSDVLVGGYKNPDCDGFRLVSRQIEGGRHGKTRLCLEMRDTKYTNMFVAMVEEVAAAVGAARGVTAAINELYSRLDLWMRFLSRFGNDLLSEDSQTGLFVETKHLVDMIRAGIPAMTAVAAWRGPYDAAIDFVFEHAAIEVKGTLSRNPVSIRISSPTQLQPPGCPLTLCSTRLEISENGDTLPEIIGVARQLCAAEPDCAAKLEAALLASGYVNIHADAYTRRYSAVRTRWFEVREGFPRIAPQDVPAGVGEVSFSISLPACAPFETAAPDFSLPPWSTGLSGA